MGKRDMTFMASRPKQDAPASPRLHAFTFVLLFALLLAFHLFANLWWLTSDNHTIRTDEEGHMLLARTYYEALFLNDYDSISERIIAVSKIEPGIPAHPPLLHIAGAVSIAIFGYSTDVIAFSGTCFFLLVLVGCYLIARSFLDPWPALFTTFVVSLTPVFYVCSRFFMTDYLTLTVSVWAIYALLRSDRFFNTAWVFVFAVLNGLAILTRSSSFLYYLLPAMSVVVAGLVTALPLWRGRPFNAHRVRGILLNCVLTVTISMGVFSPWYFHHFENLYGYWTKVYRGGTESPVVFLQPRAEDRVENRTIEEPAAASRQQGGVAPPSQGQPATPASPAGKGLAVPLAYPLGAPENAPGHKSRVEAFLEHLAHPTVPWIRYPVYIINNALFLPLVVLGLLGFLAAALSGRYRLSVILLLALWVVGGWVLLTVVIRFANPRYAIPFLPPLAIFAALAVMAPPWKRVRHGCMAALSVWLLFQYGNLTVHAYGPISRLDIPVRIDPHILDKLGDPGLVVYKDTMSVSDAYSGLCAPLAENLHDQLFLAMVRHEKKYEALLPGDYANFLRLNKRGMEFEEKHYWPLPNPYRRPRIRPEDLPRRRLHCIGGFGSAPRTLLSQLRNADYVVYGDEATDDQPSPREEEWLSFFRARGFEPIERLHVERSGPVPARNYGVLARVMEGDLVTVETTDDIDRLNFHEVYELMQLDAFRMLPDPLQAHARARFESLLGPVKPYPMNESVTFLTARLGHVEANWYEFEFVFRVEKPMDKDWRIYFHGKVQDEHLPLLPEAFRSGGAMMWNFNPSPPTKDWRAGEYVLIKHRIQAEPIPYRMRIGFSTREDGYFGGPADLGWIDIGKIPQ